MERRFELAPPQWIGLAIFAIVLLLALLETFGPTRGTSQSVGPGLAWRLEQPTLVFLTSLVSYHSDRARALLESSPVVLVQDGRLVDQHLNRERVPPDETVEALRLAGLEDLKQVRWAILESSGKISIVPRSAVRREEETAAE